MLVPPLLLMWWKLMGRPTDESRCASNSLRLQEHVIVQGQRLLISVMARKVCVGTKFGKLYAAGASILWYWLLLLSLCHTQPI
jgi:hypothetical protein